MTGYLSLVSTLRDSLRVALVHPHSRDTNLFKPTNNKLTPQDISSRLITYLLYRTSVQPGSYMICFVFNKSCINNLTLKPLFFHGQLKVQRPFLFFIFYIYLLERDGKDKRILKVKLQ